MPFTPDRPTSPHRPVASYAAAALLLISLAVGGWWSASMVAMAPSAVPPSMAVAEEGEGKGLSKSSHSQLRLSASGPSWSEINQAQRQVLMPLHERWDSMGALTKRRWLVLADRYPSMDELERTKLFSRMHTWASLSAQQRSQARLNFESAKRLSPKDLQSKWDEYQALSEAEKKRLAEQARKAKATAAKKSKRRLARVPSANPAPTSVAPLAPAEPTPPSQRTETGQVFTPTASPHVHLPPLAHNPAVTHGQEHHKNQAPAPAASSQPVATPQAAPIVNLPPLVQQPPAHGIEPSAVTH